MTTAALVAGMIPVALGRGSGGSSIRGIALVVIGGQTLCLLITLLITPVAFSLFDDLEGWVRNLRKPPGRLKLVEAGYETERHLRCLRRFGIESTPVLLLLDEATSSMFARKRILDLDGLACGRNGCARGCRVRGRGGARGSFYAIMPNDTARAHQIEERFCPIEASIARCGHQNNQRGLR